MRYDFKCFILHIERMKDMDLFKYCTVSDKEQKYCRRIYRKCRSWHINNKASLTLRCITIFYSRSSPNIKKKTHFAQKFDSFPSKAEFMLHSVMRAIEMNHSQMARDVSFIRFGISSELCNISFDFCWKNRFEIVSNEKIHQKANVFNILNLNFSFSNVNFYKIRTKW